MVTSPSGGQDPQHEATCRVGCKRRGGWELPRTATSPVHFVRQWRSRALSRSNPESWGSPRSWEVLNTIMPPRISEAYLLMPRTWCTRSTWLAASVPGSIGGDKLPPPPPHTHNPQPIDGGDAVRILGSAASMDLPWRPWQRCLPVLVSLVLLLLPPTRNTLR
jgi:hypothetical protein